MALFFYGCDSTIDLSSIVEYSFNEWHGIKVEVLRSDWQRDGEDSYDLCVDLRVTIDGYQTPEYICKALNVCGDDLRKTFGIRGFFNEIPTYQVYFDPYVAHADEKIPGDDRED